VESLVTRYGLPARAVFNHRKVMAVLKMDKKREKKDMRYILLRKIGQAYVESIPVKKLEQLIQQL
jgi:3-dehydroquinate synthetase